MISTAGNQMTELNEVRNPSNGESAATQEVNARFIRPGNRDLTLSAKQFSGGVTGQETTHVGKVFAFQVLTEYLDISIINILDVHDV